AARREHAEPGEHDRKRRRVQVITHRIDNRRGAGIVHFTEEDERQVHLLGANHPQRRSAVSTQLPYQPFLLGCNGTSRIIIEMDRDEQSHHLLLSRGPTPATCAFAPVGARLWLSRLSAQCNRRRTILSAACDAWNFTISRP